MQKEKFIQKIYIYILATCFSNHFQAHNFRHHFLSSKKKHKAVHKPHKLVRHGYFLSIQYLEDIYQSMEVQAKFFYKWYAMSKVKFRNFKSFFQVLILLSGDIAMNPGTTNYPCSKCHLGVRSGILCTSCNLWIHSRCEGLDRQQLNILLRTGN